MTSFRPEGTLSLSTQSEIDNHIPACEQRIEQLQDAAPFFKTHRNLLSHIGRLPPEIISEIFVALAREYAETYYPIYGQNPQWVKPHWLAITRVCRQWRDIAICTPRVWGYILLRPKDVDHIALFVQRSGSTLLSFTQPVHLKKFLPSSTLANIAHNMHRVRSLSCVFDLELLKLSATHSMDAPFLQGLKVNASLPGTASFPTLATAFWP